MEEEALAHHAFGGVFVDEHAFEPCHEGVALRPRREAVTRAEVLGARDVFIGVNAVDYSGYPDCRPEYIAAFERLAGLATKAGVEGARFAVRAPLLQVSKAEIIRRGLELGVDFALTVSCYRADAAGRACRVCDACRLRSAGFAAAGVADPTRYVE